MRYLAKKIKGTEYEISGIQEFETITGDKAEVIVDTKTYDKKKLKERIEALKEEQKGINENYSNTIKDIEDMLEAMGK